MQPTIGVVTQVFGVNKHFSWQPWGHLGKDYGVVVGTGCVAIAPGTVIWADWGSKMPRHLADLCTMIYGSPASGIVVVIDHGGWYSVYAHLSETHLYSKTLWRKASRVGDGEVVGKSGNTGNSTGPHLHFEVFVITGEHAATFGRYNPDWQIAEEDRRRRAAAVQHASSKPIIAAPIDPLEEIMAYYRDRRDFENHLARIVRENGIDAPVINEGDYKGKRTSPRVKYAWMAHLFKEVSELLGRVLTELAAVRRDQAAIRAAQDRAAAAAAADTTDPIEAKEQ